MPPDIKLDQRHTTPFPKFVIFHAYPHPHVWTFDTAREATNHLWGADLKYLAVFKDGKIVYLEFADLKDIERQLEEA